MTNVLKADAVYSNGRLELKDTVSLDEGEDVEVIILRKKGGIQTSTLYMEVGKGDEKNIVQGLCMVESIPSRVESFEFRDALAGLIGPSPSLIDPSLSKLEFYRMLLDKLSRKE
ncbi:MAG: hypothetical protein F7B59_04340 [Desulfurococcales archaeon]|nr:hypothetical protein [Desulfurococcales archaeon]